MILGIYELGCLLVLLFYMLIFSNINNRILFNETFKHNNKISVIFIFIIIMLGSWITILFYIKKILSK